MTANTTRSDIAWRPTANLDTLRLRAQLLGRTREYFANRNVMEVETPVLSQATVTDVHLTSLRTHIAGHGEFFLQTSPEYAMKRLLAAGSGDIYQIARVFRDEERGRWHNPEFTMVEWYRLNHDSDALMRDAAALIEYLLTGHKLNTAERLTYQQAVQRYAGVDPLTTTAKELATCLHRHGITPPSNDKQTTQNSTEERDAHLDLLMSAVVGPKLGQGHLTFIHEYPASQAALARLKPSDPRVAERFEIYLQGIELANGFHELADAGEQRQRFQTDITIRRSRGLPTPPIDERLLAALETGLPACSGIALGFDRLVMIAANAKQIDDVLAFPVERS